jgi:hypothetical protein
MMTYDPSVDSMSTPISSFEPTLNEEIARQALERPPEDSTKSVPQGLMRNLPEKKIDESQMADFSTPIEEVMQNEIMGSAQMQAPSAVRMRAAPPAEGGEERKTRSSNPFGLTDEQFQAALAGAAAVVAFSKPVQTRLRSMVPNFIGETGDTSLTGLIVSALVAAIVFFILKKFIIERA